MATTLKPISFNTEKDEEILKYIDSLDESFASYVKKLIRRDMERASSNTAENSELSELISLLKEMITTNKMMGQMPQFNPMAMMQMFGNMYGMGNMQSMTPQHPPKQEQEDEEISDGQKEAVKNIMNRFKK